MKKHLVIEDGMTGEYYVSLGRGMYMEACDWYGDGGNTYYEEDLSQGYYELGTFTAAEIERLF